MATEWGFVYFLSNDSMPGVFKIGFTNRHPRFRIAELSSATGCPEPFELAAYFGAYQPHKFESQIHNELAAFRVNKSREFFRVHPTVIAEIIDKYSYDHDDAVFRRPVDFMIALEDYERSTEK